jgi:hypothetical protein
MRQFGGSDHDRLANASTYIASLLILTELACANMEWAQDRAAWSSSHRNAYPQHARRRDPLSARVATSDICPDTIESPLDGRRSQLLRWHNPEQFLLVG